MNKPWIVSIFSFLAMLLLVSLIGWFSGQHIIHYLKQEWIEHGISHHRNILNELSQTLESSLQTDHFDQVLKNFQNFIDHAEPFGVSIYLWDRKKRLVLADSQIKNHQIYPIEQLHWQLFSIDGRPIDDFASWQGHARQIKPQDHLISIMPLNQSNLSLAVRSELGPLLRFIDNLNWHLNLFLLVTDTIIAVLGFLVLRWIGRFYELNLEKQIQMRTQELKQAEQKLLDQARLVTIGQTTAVLTHEMRNPLASIQLALSSIAKEAHLSARAQRRIQLVQNEVFRLENLLNNTLDYVKPIKKDKRAQSILNLLDQVIEIEQPHIQSKSLRIEWIERQNCPPILIDSQKMQQVLLNVLKNAIEASPVNTWIKIALRCSEQIEIEIINPGQMDEHIKTKAFDYFFTTKAKGTGLGLGLVKRVIEEHGGQVKLDHRQGEIFIHIRLPKQ